MENAAYQTKAIGAAARTCRNNVRMPEKVEYKSSLPSLFLSKAFPALMFHDLILRMIIIGTLINN